jgi:hypothetical protein
MKRSWIIAVLLLFLIASPAVAKEGLYIGGFVFYDTISGDSSYVDDIDDGLGLGLRAGIGFNRYLALEGSLSRSHNSDIGGDGNIDAATVDLKLNFPLTGTDVAPYLMLGVGRYNVGDDRLKGEGWNFGIGIDYYLRPEVSLNFGFTWDTITFDSGSLHAQDVDSDIKVIDVGIAYHFF